MPKTKAYTRAERDRMDQQTQGTPYVIYPQGKGEGIPIKNTPSKKTTKRSGKKGK